MKTISIVIMILDVLNHNGRTYTTNVMQKAIDMCKPDIIGGIDAVDEKLMIDIEKVSHTINNLHIVGGELIGDVNILKTPMGKILNDVLETDNDCVRFVPYGYGKIDCSGMVSDYELISISAVFNNE